MACFPAHPNSRLTALQVDLLEGFFARDEEFFLTGGAALAGFFLGHRETNDLDLFSLPGSSLDDAVRVVQEAASACRASCEMARSFAEFKRVIVSRGSERCVVDLVIDRAPALFREKERIGIVRLDSLREIAANKVCALVGRSEIKDLIDLAELARAGVDLEQALTDAATKDGGVDPSTLAWILDQLAIGSEARLPAGVAVDELEAFRKALLLRMRALAFDQATPAR